MIKSNSNLIALSPKKIMTNSSSYQKREIEAKRTAISNQINRKEHKKIIKKVQLLKRTERPIIIKAIISRIKKNN